MDGVMLARSVATGLMSVPMDFYLGIERTFQDLNLSDGGRTAQRRNLHDDVRVARAIRNLFRDRDVIRKIAVIIIDDALRDLPEPALQKLHDKLIGAATSAASRTTLQISISSYLGSKVVGGMMASVITRLSMRALTGGLTGGIVAQGVISRACEASRRLQTQNPALWRKLHIRDYDMLYFFFEEPLKNFIEMKQTFQKKPAKTEDFLRALENL